jgi:two-component system chemotaxis sensor kinase CheA
VDDIVKEFIAETSEVLAALDNDLVLLESQAEDVALVARIFRAVHTIKGTCGFLGLNRLRNVAHATENVLDQLRRGELTASGEVVTAILGALDLLKAIVGALAATGTEGEGDDSAMIAALERILRDVDGAPSRPGDEMASLAEAGFGSDVSRPVDPQARTGFDPVPAEAELPHPATPAVAPEGGADKLAAQPGTTVQDAGQETIRVSLALLDTLMMSVSELVLTRNQIMQLVRNNRDTTLNGPLQRLNQVVSELQDDVMKTRMQPVGNAWSKLPRIVRDLARELDKRIELRMTGQETELDRQVLELIRDPLTHMVRNSCDHGLETRAERLAAGKNESGVIALHAYHEGGHIVIRLSDDGRGLDLDRIRAKVVERGLASAAELAGMSDAQVGNFIFRPGFSTAARVTDVSGRGVGMDVVRTNVERIGGTIELMTARGKGSTFTIKIPLTLAIVNALIVECDGQRYAVPQIAVSELVSAGGSGERRIEWIRNSAVLRLRERLLPLISLRDVLAGQGAPRMAPPDNALILVTRVGSYDFGIIVDRSNDTEEIVVKPVAPLLKSLSVYSGNTILGDGSVCMILDPAGVLARAQVDVSGAAASTRAASEAVAAQHGADEAISLLVVQAGGGMRKAIPLDLIARLEEISTDELHHTNGAMIIKYQDRLMPLIAASPEVELARGQRKPVLVFTDADRSVGLIVDRIDDIVRSRVDVELSVGRADVIGSALINGEPTEILNTSHLVIRAAQDWFRTPRSEKASSRRVLLVDDSAFFRALVAPVIRSAGLEVVQAGSGEEALEQLENGPVFDLVVSDLEMPGIDGYALARRISTDPRWSRIPVIALSSHSEPSDVARCRAAGFARHVPKTEGDSIAHAIHETIALEQAP